MMPLKFHSKKEDSKTSNILEFWFIGSYFLTPWKPFKTIKKYVWQEKKTHFILDLELMMVFVACDWVHSSEIKI